MGRSWDKDKGGMLEWVNWLSAVMAEALRVMKPGACGVVWSIPRTCGWTQLALEMAGFRVIDSIAILNGSGFPKAQDLYGKIAEIQALEMYNLIDSIKRELHQCVKKNNASIAQSLFINKQGNPLNNGSCDNFALMFVAENPCLPIDRLKTVKIADKSLQKKQTATGTNTRKSDFVAGNALESLDAQHQRLLAVIADLQSLGHLHIKEGGFIAQENANPQIKQLPNHVTIAELSSPSQNLTQYCTKVFSVPVTVPMLECVQTTVTIKVEEALKIGNGNQVFLSPADINALCVAAIEGLKLTILSQSKTFQNFDTTFQTECASAINVTITKSIEECLISSMVNTAERKNAENQKQWDGWKTPALKPAHESWFLVQKPISEGNIARNVLTWGVGGLNIEAARIEGKITYKMSSVGSVGAGRERGCNVYDRGDGKTPDGRDYKKVVERQQRYAEEAKLTPPKTVSGRFPANCILIHSLECTPDGCADHCPVTVLGEQNQNSPARYFKQLPHDPDTFKYFTKASKRDRTCNGMVDNKHPTVKSTALMEYFCKLLCPPGGVVLDPFGGSGSTALGALMAGMDYLLIEQDADSVEVANARIEAWQFQNSTEQPTLKNNLANSKGGDD